MTSLIVPSRKLLLLASTIPLVAASCASECDAPSPDGIPASILDTGCVNSDNPSEPAAGVFHYEVAQTFWSDGADKDRWFSLPGDEKMTIHEDGSWSLPVGAVTMKHFRQGGKLFETRFYVRDAEDSYHGYTYQWNVDESDATLVGPEGLSGVNIGGQLSNWDFPSRSACNECHKEANDFFVGFETRQLNIGASDTPLGLTGNQITLLDEAGNVEGQLNDGTVVAANSMLLQGAYARGPNSEGWNLQDVIGAGPEELAREARSYLAVNCSYCHNSEGSLSAFFDASFDIPLDSTRMCEPALLQPSTLVVDPGSPDSSRIFQRQSVRDASSGSREQMPPLGTHVRDEEGSALIAAWIRSLDECNN